MPEKEKNLNEGARRAATVLIALGPEEARSIMMGMQEEELRRIVQASKNIQSKPGEISDLLSNFLKSIEGHEGDMATGDQLLRSVVENSMGGEISRRLFDDVSIASSQNVLGTLGTADPEALAMALAREKPQTVALVLGALEPEQASAVFEKYPEDLRQDVIRRLAMVESVAPEILKEVSSALAADMNVIMAGGMKTLRGKDIAVSLLREGDIDLQDSVLSSIEPDNPELAEWLKAKLFTLEDVLALPDNAIQLILREVSSETLVVAMKGMSQELRDRVLGNLSSRVSMMIQDELDLIGPMRIEIVEEAQMELVMVARRLADDGRIEIIRSSDKLV